MTTFLFDVGSAVGFFMPVGVGTSMRRYT
jgi:hypothetical protein